MGQGHIIGHAELGRFQNAIHTIGQKGNIPMLSTHTSQPAHDHNRVVSSGLLHFLHVPNHFEQRLVVFRASALCPTFVMQLGHFQRRGSLRQERTIGPSTG